MQKQFVVSETNEKYQFIWKVITPVAEMLWLNCPFAFEMYVLHEDGSESLVHEVEDIQQAIVNGLEIGIEVGWVPFPSLSQVDAEDIAEQEYFRSHPELNP